MIKRFMSVLMIAIMILSISAPVSASQSKMIVETETTYLEDGSFFIDTLTMSPITARASEKEASKSRDFYDANGKLAWTFTINGVFIYDGSTAKATDASCSSSIKISGWTCTSKSARCSNASVIGDASFKYNGVSYSANLTLTCSPSGTIK